MDALEQEIIQLVCDETGAPRKKVTLDSRLCQDLGIDGADGLELIEEFGRRYHVNTSEIRWELYFGPEAGATPFHVIWWLIAFVFRIEDKAIPIRVADLVRCARAEKWLL